MQILVDKNQVTGSHAMSNNKLHKGLINAGHELFSAPLPFGDYTELTEDVLETINRRGTKLKKADLIGDINVSVDRKNSMQEIAGNIVGKTHARFRDEVILAQKNNCKLCILIENTDGIKSINDVFSWVNPRYMKWCGLKKLKDQGKAKNAKLSSKPPVRGVQLAKAMITMEKKYGVEFLFCKPEESPGKVVELLCSTNR